MRGVWALLVCAGMIVGAGAGCGRRKGEAKPPAVQPEAERPGGVGRVGVPREAGPGEDEMRPPGAGAPTTPVVGTGEAAGADEPEIGIPAYPGARAAGSGRGQGEEGVEVAQEAFVTGDSVERVKAWYEQRFPEAEVPVEIHTPELQLVQMRLEEGGVQRVIMISRDQSGGETRIVLGRVGKEE